MKEIKGIVFDMDGVLIDSEPVHIEAWNDVFAEFNLYFETEWIIYSGRIYVDHFKKILI